MLFENTGTATNAAFARRSGPANPFGPFELGIDASPALGDLDGDGDADLVAGESQGLLAYFENTGSASAAAFVRRTGALDPLAGFQLPGGYANPALGDLDGDGDLELVAGQRSPTVFVYFENTGTAASPAFALRTGAANPLGAFNTGAIYTSPALVDIDADGDLDVFSGVPTSTYSKTVAYFQNTGSATTPAFVQRVGAANPLSAFNGATSALNLNPEPAFLDVDRDGDLDAVFFGEAYFENTGSPGAPAFSLTNADKKLLLRVDPSRHLTSADLDGDGRPEVLTGFDHSFLYFDEVQADPRYVARTGAANPVSGLSFLIPSFGDLDADGDFDVVAGFGVTLLYFENAGTPAAPQLIARTGAANPLTGIAVGVFSAPYFGDLDSDADLDLVIGAAGGQIAYVENTGTPTQPAFVPRSGAANPFDGFSQPLNCLGIGCPFSSPVLADIDGDGDLDAFSGDVFFLNTESPQNPAMQVIGGGALNPLAGLAATDLGDVDGDGDLDVLSGGTVYRNTGSATAPAFAAVTPAPAGSFPRWVDFDGDGALDLVAFGPGGQSHLYFEQVPPIPLALPAWLGAIAGLSLLRGAWQRLRERSTA